MKLLISILPLVLGALGNDVRAELPTINSNSARVSIRDGSQLKSNGWVLSPDAKPDVYLVGLIGGKARTVTFITDVDSISFVVELGQSYDFVIQWGEQVCHTRITGELFVPAAVFDEAYQAQNRGKILVEIPEVYELVNIAIAMTSFGKQNRNFVYHDSPYYSRALERFDAHAGHPFVVSLDSLLTDNSGRYARLKMNGYSFVFDEDDRIVQSAVYDRTGFTGDRSNRLRPYIKQMQSFADASRFRSFYKDNAEVYSNYIAFFSDSAGVGEMKRWLDSNFPGSDDYDVYKIIFSPLVSYNQSSTRFESNGFRELQAHVNFPYREDAKRFGELSQLAETISRGSIVFTEINHGYINPEGEKYRVRISEAISNRDKWVDKKKGPGYYGGNSAFTEYMNWGLICLRIMDYVPEDEQEKLIVRVERTMVRGRGFIQFESYNRFLMDLYANRAPQATVADLYPDIIEWFEQNN
jgi:hypothetical protein